MNAAVKGISTVSNAVQIPEHSGSSTRSPSLETLLAAIEANSRILSEVVGAQRSQGKQFIELNAKIDANSRALSDVAGAQRNQREQFTELNAKFDRLAQLPATVDAISTALESLSRTSTDFSIEVRGQLENLTAENTCLKNRVTVLETELASAVAVQASDITRLTEENVTLASRLGQMECNLLNRDLVISGVPELPAEKLDSILCSTAALLAVPLQPSDITEVSRMKSTRQTDQPRMIFARLAGPELRNSLLSAKRGKGSIYADELGLAGVHPHTPVFINERLTPAMANLLRKVRARAKSLGFSYVWVNNGAVRAKLDASSQPIIFRSEADLGLLPEAPSTSRETVGSDRS